MGCAVPPEVRPRRLIVTSDLPAGDTRFDRHLDALIGADRRTELKIERTGVGPDGLARLLRHRGDAHIITRGRDAVSWARIGGWGLAASLGGSRASITLFDRDCAHYVTTPSRALIVRAALSLFGEVFAMDEDVARTLSRIGVRPDRLHTTIAPSGARLDQHRNASTGRS